MPKKLMILAPFIFTSLLCGAQSTSPLYIGDKVPDLRSFEFYGSDSDSIFLRSDKRLTILDFWNVYCASCIAKMPEMEDLQKQYAGAIEIILVTNDTRQQVDKLFSRIQRNRPHLRMIVNDTLLNKLFPHQSVPHHVWIDSAGVVRHITYGYNTHTENIRDFIAGKPVKMQVKQEIIDFDWSKSLLLEGKGRLTHHLKYYSLLMERLSEVGSSSVSVKIDSVKNIAQLKVINQPVIELLKIAFNETITPDRFSLNNRIIIEAGNKERLFYPSGKSEIDDWKNKNVFCYEAAAPVEQKEQLYAMLRQDIARYFHYEGEIEKRKVTCLVLTRWGKSPLGQRGTGKAQITATPTSISIRNAPLGSTLASIIASYNRNIATPVLDGTNDDSLGDIDIKAPLNNIQLLKISLQKRGLNLVEQEREIDMLVIREKGEGRIKKE